LRECVRELNAVYKSAPALYARDCEPAGFQWVVSDDRDNSVIAWVRWGAPGDAPVMMVTNFTPVPRPAYRVGLPKSGYWTEILNTDAAQYGGSGCGNLGGVTATDQPSHGCPSSAEVFLPPLATLYFRHQQP
jgi:1,4-alpha-glucan branching enzyme